MGPPGSVDTMPAGFYFWAAEATTFAEEIGMRKWKKPRIVEIAIGLEINAYACAEV